MKLELFYKNKYVDFFPINAIQKNIIIFNSIEEMPCIIKGQIIEYYIDYIPIIRYVTTSKDNLRIKPYYF